MNFSSLYQVTINGGSGDDKYFVLNTSPNASTEIHAGDGTVFLDEIGELPPATQAKLLRTIEQKEAQPVGANEPVRIEARVLAATNKDLHAEVEAGRCTHLQPVRRT